jgi:hypothetical protein
MALSFMVIDNLYVVGIALAVSETDAPAFIYGHSPLVATFAFKLVKADTSQWTKVL